MCPVECGQLSTFRKRQVCHRNLSFSVLPEILKTWYKILSLLCREANWWFLPFLGRLRYSLALPGACVVSLFWFSLPISTAVCSWPGRMPCAVPGAPLLAFLASTDLASMHPAQAAAAWSWKAGEFGVCVWQLKAFQSALWASSWQGGVTSCCLGQSEGSEQDLRASPHPFAEHQGAGQLRLAAVRLRRGPGSPQRRRPVPRPGRGDQCQLRGLALCHGLWQWQWRWHQHRLRPRHPRAPLQDRRCRHGSAT